ncbi:MAG: hypothetical protein WC325_04465 [Candidatus Bathyarchaeia archaeon]|jgi:hypothetical protein
MQINKKLYTTFVIAILTLSILAAAIPMASAEITTAPFVVTHLGTTAVPGGAVGTVVDVVGNATSGAASPFSTVRVYWDALSGAVLGTGSADVNGAYRIAVTIPAAVFGTHYLVVNDGETESEGTAFAVSPVIYVSTIPPTYGTPRALPGDSLSISGHGFAAYDAIAITFHNGTFGDPLTITLTSPAITSNATGSWSATILVPSTITYADFGDFTVNATDEADNWAVKTVTVDYYIGCSPAAGPVGITTTISGRIQPSVAYTIRFNGATIGSGTTAADGAYSMPYTIPSVLSTGGYTVDIVWATINTRDTTFTVNPSPTIVLGASSGYVGDVVTISGSGFSSGATITLYFNDIIVNSTAMDSHFGPTRTGAFAGQLPSGLTFVVPSVSSTVYAVKVVDQYGATSALVYFTVNPTPVTNIALRANAYFQGDVLSFSITTTDRFASDQCTVTVKDPSGLTWWTAVWMLDETSTGVYNMLYQNQMVNNNYLMLSADAPTTGSWNWTITYIATVKGAGKATGLFTVAVPPTTQTVLDQLEVVRSNITAAITTSQGVIITNLNGLDAKLTSITNNIATIQTTVGSIQTSVSNLNIGSLGSDVMAIADDVATIMTDIGTLQADVSDLGMSVTSIEGDVATIQTDLGTLQGTVTSIDDGVATIQTDVGAVQLDVTDVLAKAEVDMTPVWIAVVLSLVAAIAAIFAVITIRSKIAG